MEEGYTKRITDMELRELPFGSKVRTIWHNSNHHEKGEEYYGVEFGGISQQDLLMQIKGTIVHVAMEDEKSE